MTPEQKEKVSAERSGKRTGRGSGEKQTKEKRNG